MTRVEKLSTEKGSESKWALITELCINAGNKLCHLVDKMWRAGISDKDLICQSAMELFMMATEIDSPHKSSILMCARCLVMIMKCFKCATKNNTSRMRNSSVYCVGVH